MTYDINYTIIKYSTCEYNQKPITESMACQLP